MTWRLECNTIICVTLARRIPSWPQQRVLQRIADSDEEEESDADDDDEEESSDDEDAAAAGSPAARLQAKVQRELKG